MARRTWSWWQLLGQGLKVDTPKDTGHTTHYTSHITVCTYMYTLHVEWFLQGIKKMAPSSWGIPPSIVHWKNPSPFSKCFGTKISWGTGLPFNGSPVPSTEYTGVLEFLDALLSWEFAKSHRRQPKMSPSQTSGRNKSTNCVPKSRAQAKKEMHVKTEYIRNDATCRSRAHKDK